MQDDADHTGNTILVFAEASELDAKCQETLLELVPSRRCGRIGKHTNLACDKPARGT
jgi:hypothetical protein